MNEDYLSDAFVGYVSLTRIRQFEPKPEGFAQEPDGIHGLGHETRILIWSQVLAAMVVNDGLEVDRDVLGWTTAVHDTRRWNDGIDPDHVARAAYWILNRPHLISTSASLDQIAYVCLWHVPSDERAPEMTPELRVFKDADVLDRWRIDDLDPSDLRTSAAGRLLDANYGPWEATYGIEHATEMFEVILDVAMDQGLVVDA